jgi:cytochrome-b5 reductase
MTQHMKHMTVGQELAFKHIKFNVKIQAPFEANHIGMIVGGTGITPMIQALHAILGDDSNNKKKVTMLYGSRTADDILGMELLEAWATKYPNQLEIVHCLSDEPADSAWTGHRGFISKNLVETSLASSKEGNKVIIFVCGPPPLYNVFCGPREDKALSGMLADLGYDASQVVKF